MKTYSRKAGFSLIEVLVGLFLVAVSVLGLAQLFLAAVANNRNADRAANAVFLAQQQIDWLRGFTSDELAAYTASGLATRDEVLDLNLDGTNDFRRITTIEPAATSPASQVGVRVYSAEKLSEGAQTLIEHPELHRPRAFISTIIAR